MTPFELDILLHYYGHADDHPVVQKNPPVWIETRTAFFAEKLLEPEPTVAPRGYPQRAYRLTQRGRAYIGFVLSVPLPVNTWQLPEPSMLDGIRFPERTDAAVERSEEKK